MKGSALFSLSFAAVLAGCATDLVAQEGALGSADICQIKNADEQYVGRTVHVTARLKTDLRHYMFLQNDICGKDEILRIGSAWGNEEFETLRKTWLADCAKEGWAGLCVIDDPVEVVGKVRSSNEGGIVIDVISIKAGSD